MDYPGGDHWLPRRCLAAATTFVVYFGLALAPGGALETQSLLGTWQSNFGSITIVEADDTTFIGIYAYQNQPARIYAARTDEGIYEGYWVQETSEVICRDAKKGRNTWGRFKFAFSGTKFLGLWNYCGRSLVNAKRFHWRGSLLNRND